MRSRTAWVTGATGFWGRKTVLSLLRQNWRVIALSRTRPEEMMAWAEAQKKQLEWVPFDFLNPDTVIFNDAAMVPQALFHCAAVCDDDLDTMLQVNVVAPIRLIEQVLPQMQTAGYGRIGVFLGQNGRLGLPGLGPFSATQGALWAWSEAQSRVLSKAEGDVSLSLVFPARAPSHLQGQLAEKLTKKPKLSPPPNADNLVRGVLAGKRRVGRRPLIAGLATIIT
jgi:NAD(P)-dependent dehydrogenase (short-subunit alcohol dehydrogenase family)